MLESLLIRNFQGHSRFELVLDPAITTLLGPSDSCKSATLRALRWLCLNKPGGDGFRRRGSKFTKVVLKADGRTITRKKGKGNTYSLNGKVFKAVGQGNVPEEITALLNVGEECFQDQHAPHFWLSLTPGQVSRELNAVINLDVIDTALANIASDIRKARATADVVQGRLQEAQTQRDALAWVEAAEVKLRSLEKMEKDAQALQGRAEALEALLEEGATLEAKARSAFAGRRKALAALQAAEAYQTAFSAQRGLEGLLGGLEAAEQELAQKRKVAREAQGRLVAALGAGCPLCGK